MTPMDSENDLSRLDDAAQADAREGIRQGLEDAKSGNVMPARAFFAKFEAAHQIVS